LTPSLGTSIGSKKLKERKKERKKASKQASKQMVTLIEKSMIVPALNILENDFLNPSQQEDNKQKGTEV